MTINTPSWEAKTRPFRERLKGIQARNGALTLELRQLPVAPFEASPSSEAMLKYQCCLHLLFVHRASNELLDAAVLLWSSGHVYAGSMAVRQIIEHCGALSYLLSSILKKSEVDPEIAESRLKKLLLGSKSSVPSPRGEVIDIPAINVMDFVRALEEHVPQLVACYNRLCDASHPSFNQNQYLMMAGAGHDNWSNKNLANYLLRELEHSVRACEQSFDHIETAGLEILRICLPQILAGVR